MGRVAYQEYFDEDSEDYFATEEKNYQEQSSLHISEEWDTLMEDFLDEFDDYHDVDFPRVDEDF